MFKKSGLVDIALIFLYKCILALGFSYLVFPLYGGQVEIAQTAVGGANGVKIFISYVVAGVCVLMFRSIRDNYKASRFVMLIQLLMIVIPFSVLYGSLNYPAWQMGLMLLGYAGAVFFIKMLPAIRLRALNARMCAALLFAMVAVVLYVYASLVATGGLHRLNFNLVKVYEVRAQLSDNQFPLSGYFIPWVAYVFNMAALTNYMSIRNIYRKRALMGVIFVISMQMLLFGMTNFKAFLFLPFVIIFLMLFMGKVNLFRSAAIGISAALACLVIISLVGVSFGAAIVDRLFVTPPALHALYFNYFSTHPLGLLQGTVGGAFGSTYDESIIAVVSKFYWGRVFDPNVGWIGDAFANFGAFGVLIYSLILALTLRLADGFVDERTPNGVVEGLLFGFAFGITNSALLTSLLTGGYIVAMASLWVMTSRWKRFHSPPIQAF